jgi:hypothetical protein
MADSTSNLDLISVSQAQKEVTANELLNAASPATLYANRASTTSLLTWGFYGGRFNGMSVANGTISLTASSTNYIVAEIATGTVSVDTVSTNWNDTADYLRLYEVVTGTTSVTSFTDYRTILNYFPTTLPYDIVVWYPQVPGADQVILKMKLTREVVFSEDFAGSTSAQSIVQAAATTVFSIKRNGTEVGTATYAATGNTATFATTNPGDLTFDAGDTLEIVAPTTPDSTLEGVSFVLLGTR